MTEFIYLKTDERVTTKNNTNNVSVGDKIEIIEDDGITHLFGKVKSVSHVIIKRHNKQGLERSTHDIKIEIE